MISVRTNLVVGFWVLCLFVISSCSSIKDPEKIGEKVFEILKRADKLNEQEYASYFMSIEEIREIGKDSVLVTEAKKRNELTSMLKDNWDTLQREDLNRIKSAGGHDGIDWQNIKYSDFIYKVENSEGMKGVEGTLYFNHNDKSFKISTISIWNGAGYKLIRVRDLLSI